MSDQTTSGSKPSGAPAETTSAPAAPAADWGASFGATRGSGLARGKRVSSPASASAPASSNAVTGTYKPSAVQIVTSASEYKNPFAPADEAPVAEPAPIAASAPTPVVVAPAPVAFVAQPVEAPASAPVAPAAPVINPVSTPKVAEKAELNILPAAELKRPSQSWETPAFPYEGKNTPAPRRDQPAPAAPVAGSLADREVFKPERRSEVPMLESAPNAGGQQQQYPHRDQRDSRQPRQPRDPREQRQPRDPRESRQPRDPRDYEPKPAFQSPAPSAAKPKKSGGIIGWFKRLFSGGSSTEKPAQHDTPPYGERDRDGNQRRHQRGGRGRSGGFQGGGPRPEGHSPNHGGQGQHHGQSQGDQGYHGGRRRRRGGRNRNGGGGPRPEGGGQGPAS